MNIDKKQYRLLKDLPITLAGTIFIQKEFNSSVYKPENGSWMEEVSEETVTKKNKYLMTFTTNY